MKSGTESPLEATQVEPLLQALAPVQPPAELAERVRRRVLARVAADGLAARMFEVRLSEGWQPFCDGVRMKVLHDDGQTMSWLVELAAGCRLPAHEHEGAEECLVVSGDVCLNGERFGPGDYQFAAGGTRHDEVRSEGGCLLLIRSPSPRHVRATAAAG